MRIVIAGSGVTVYFLAKRFTSKGHKVSIISDSQEDCDYYARNLKALVINGECSDLDVLTQAETHAAEIFIGMTQRDQDNLVVSQIAQAYFNVPRIIAVVNDPDNEKVFQKMGIRALSPSLFLLEAIESMSSLEEVRHQFSAVEGRVLLTELEIRRESKSVGRLLKDIALPGGVLVGVVLRGENIIIPQGDTEILPGDRMLVLSQADNLSIVLNILS
jgi:trk system potassium uptake protein TrkA